MTGEAVAMDTKQNTRILIILLVVSIALAVLVITGLGIETRDISVFPTWQQGLFSYGGTIMEILAILAAGTVFRWVRLGAQLAVVSAAFALILSIVGIALFGAPTAPIGVVAIDSIHIVVAFAIIYFAVMVWRSAPLKAVAPPTK